MHLTPGNESVNFNENKTNDGEEKGKDEEEPRKSLSRLLLESWLNKNVKIKMTDGRVLIGIFLCTDRDCDVILGSCAEYLKFEEDETDEEPRVLGLALIPGHHIISIHVDSNSNVPPEEIL